jgi:hypothetical protein
MQFVCHLTQPSVTRDNTTSTSALWNLCKLDCWLKERTGISVAYLCHLTQLVAPSQPYEDPFRRENLSLRINLTRNNHGSILLPPHLLSETSIWICILYSLSEACSDRYMASAAARFQCFSPEWRQDNCQSEDPTRP